MLSRGRLAGIIGYRNVSKGSRRIFAFESGLRLDRLLLAKIVDSLRMPKSEVELAWLGDWHDHYRRWEDWIDEPVPQSVLRLSVWGLYPWYAINRHIDRLRDAERLASRIAVNTNASSWLVFSRRVISCFDHRGRLVTRIEAIAPELGEPFADCQQNLWREIKRTSRPKTSYSPTHSCGRTPNQ